MASLLADLVRALFGGYGADWVHVVPYVVEVDKLGKSVELAQAGKSVLSIRPHETKGRIRPLLDRDCFGEIAGAIDVGAFDQGRMVSKQLYRDGMQDRREQADMPR